MRPVFRGWKSRSWAAASLSVVLFGAIAVPALAGARAATPAEKPPAKTSMKPGVKSAAALSTGTLEICKSDSHGMAGRAFQFSVNGAAPISVVGGACSAPLSVTAGNATVTEAPTSDTKVVGIRSNHLISKNVAARSAVVAVKGGSTPANESVVTFFNADLPVLGLKICKAADATSLGLVGALFSFTENGGPAFSVAAGTVAAPTCGPITKYALGTTVDVAELATTMTHASAITVSDGRGTNVNLKQGTVTATVGAGVTVVTYTNAMNPIVQTGFVEVCKRARGPFVLGDFRFIITAPKFQLRQTVQVGQCTPAIEVPAGPVTIAEATSAHYVVSSIAAIPAGRLTNKNKDNGTATITVPVGDTSTETQVTFTNQALTGQVKVCKTLAANSSELQGKPFTFKVSSTALAHTQTDTVTAGAAGTTACALQTNTLPLGASVSITEVAQASVQTVGVSVSPANRDTGSVSPVANLKVGSGVTTATFTNEAFGTLEVCKSAADPSTATQAFQFTVNGGAPISVHAGQCSPAISVPAGTASVMEVSNPNFQLVGVTAEGSQQENRLTSGPTANPAVVSVPFGGVGNETVATFTNAVVTGQLKICKVSSEPTLQGVTFNFTYSYTVNGATTNGTAALTPGSCSGLTANIPVVDQNGNAIPISVAELPQPTAQVSDIAVANGTLMASNTMAGTSTVSVNAGITMLTYTNVRSPFGSITVCKKAADASTAGQTFQFTVNGGAPFAVPAGSCAPAMTVLTGPATVQEVGSTNFHLVGITAAGPLGDNRLTTGPTVNPATVTVPPGDAGNGTTVTFTDAVNTGQLEICKASTEPTLANTTFNFEFQYSANGSNVSGSAALMPGQCSAPSSAVPVVDSAGNPVPIQIFEDATLGVAVSTITVDGGSLTGTDTSAGSTTAFVSAGVVTTVTFTNVLEPPRTLVVCKAAADLSTGAQTSFQFSVNGGTAFSVAPGACAPAIVLPIAGDTATVSEVATPNFHLVGVKAVGPAGDNRLTSAATDNPATVSVPFGGAANQTTVTFTNAVDTGQLTICKASAEPTLQTTTFDFAYTYTVNGTTTNGTAALTPGQCSDPTGAIPVIDASGNPIAVAISETATTGIVVSDIEVDNGTLPGTNLVAGTATANVKVGATKVTFTNSLAPSPPG